MEDTASLDAHYLRTVVPVMRELGVAAFGAVTLGPPPAPAKALEHAIETAPDERRDFLKKEHAEALRKERLEAAREDMRLTLAHTGRTYSDAEIDRMLGPLE